MANEKNDHYDIQDESEYHFSDDQAEYEIENEASTTSTAAPAKNKIFAKLGDSRRFLIGGGIVLVLVYIVYKVLLPAPPAPPSAEIAEGPARPKVTQTAPPAGPSQLVPQTTPAAAPPMPPAAPLAETNASAAPFVPSTEVATTPPSPSQAMPVSSTAMAPLATPTSSLASEVSAQAVPSNVIERLTVVEQQNAKIVELLQTQYGQKVMDVEEQNKAMNEKVRALNKRLGNIEASLNQMARLLEGNDRSGMIPVGPTPKSAEPKMMYTVQAIIPGRAWLKTDSGETVTVAEGDVLKNYGRITKIDPYDGIVDIDTGSRILTLSYGTNADQ